MTPQEAAEESEKGVETMRIIHAIVDFKKHFEKFRSEPFKSSLLYWIMTGTISGNFAIAIDNFAKEMHTDGACEKDQALSSALKEIAELTSWKNEMLQLWNKLDAYIETRKDIRLGESKVDFAIKIMKERDEIQDDMCSVCRVYQNLKLWDKSKNSDRLSPESHSEPNSANLPPEVTS